MQNNQQQHRTLALAGIFQAAQLVDQLAQTSMADTTPLESSLHSLLSLDSDSTEDVYSSNPHGINAGLRCGFRTLGKQLDPKQQAASTDIMRYTLTLAHLEKKLARRPDLIDVIQQGIQAVQKPLQHYGLLHETVIRKLADIYSQSVSLLTPRILINGQKPYLSNPHITEKARALLLAGMRSAVLWRQCGGGRWELLFHRQRYLSISQHYLK
ncbi:MAG TPA: high frequency lysogenization protein HflD [Myxococcales bacterium]|nr:high frequency lysogenization protein HflD [Myxococcales bacterium]